MCVVKGCRMTVSDRCTYVHDLHSEVPAKWPIPARPADSVLVGLLVHRSGRRPAVLLSGPLRVAGALPSGARVRSGLKCRPGVGGVRGGPWTAPLGAPADLNPPSVTSEWAAVTEGSCGARPPSCSVVRVAPARRCGFAGVGPAAVALTASPFLLRGGAPPRPWGGGGPRLWLPS